MNDCIPPGVASSWGLGLAVRDGLLVGLLLRLLSVPGDEAAGRPERLPTVAVPDPSSLPAVKATHPTRAMAMSATTAAPAGATPMRRRAGAAAAGAARVVCVAGGGPAGGGTGGTARESTWVAAGSAATVVALGCTGAWGPAARKSRTRAIDQRSAGSV